MEKTLKTAALLLNHAMAHLVIQQSSPTNSLLLISGSLHIHKTVNTCEITKNL